MSNRQILDLPKHQNPSQNRAASAPYNFVPLPEVVVTAVDNADDLPSHDRHYADHHTGHFEVTLTTKSPLYVRCPFTRDEFDLDEQGKDRSGHEVNNQTPYADRIRNTPHFFYRRNPNEPVIPGSSLRGMIRSVLEIASYGKVQWVTDKKLFFRTVDATALGKYYSSRIMDQGATGQSHNGYRPLVEAGFIRRSGDNWQIEPCQVAKVEMMDVAVAFGVIDRDQSIQNLYTNRDPSGQLPRWEIKQAGTTTPIPLQHSEVFVITDSTPRDYLHSRRHYLRYCRVNSISRTPTGQQGEQPGILVLTGPVPHKHMAFVFIPTPNATRINIPNDFHEQDINKRLVDLFHDKDQLTQWQTQAFPKGKPGGAQRNQDGFLRDGEPIFFLRENRQLTFFGRAQMFRLPYTKCPVDLVPEDLRHPEDIDYAEALFGFVRKKEELQDMMRRGVIQKMPKQGDKRRAYAGRVFVTDAMLVEGQADYWLFSDPITPKILATPKPTAFQHYLTQQEPDEKNRLDHYDSPPPHETTIRGHKRYWHQGLNPSNGLTADQIREHIGEELVTITQHTQFKPIKAGVQFKFRIYFENLSSRELGALCWTLQPLGNPAKEYCHHLGMGKPLGMGAVKLEATLCLTDRSRRYASLLEGDNWQTGTIGTAESLSDRATLKRRTQDFEQHILDALKLSTTCQHLFELKRVGMLLKMMEWPGFRADLNGKCFLKDQKRPNTRYMTIQRNNEYRERPVLPDPSAFDPAIDKLAEPVPDNGNPQKDVPREHGPAPRQAKQDQRPTVPQGAVVATVQKVGDKWVDVQIEGHEALIRCTGVNPAGLGLKPGSTIYVELKRDKKTKKIISSRYHSKP
jgi:CRISPR-associated protein (TIGR03986 family)